MLKRGLFQSSLYNERSVPIFVAFTKQSLREHQKNMNSWFSPQALARSDGIKSFQLKAFLSNYY